jgi:hypothetical protein
MKAEMANEQEVAQWGKLSSSDLGGGGEYILLDFQSTNIFL